MNKGLTQGNAKRLIDAAQRALEDLCYLHEEYLYMIEQADPTDLKFYHPHGSCLICSKSIPELTEALETIKANFPLAIVQKVERPEESFIEAEAVGL
jgi:hypothetical protein